MSLKDHYLEEDMDKVLNHIENIAEAGLNGLKSAKTANEDLAKNALFQINHSMKAILDYNKKKLGKENRFNKVNEQVRKDWF
ncbi:hypothetical protein JUJ52_02475 [Virgibacillus sp. AGTR]|uniref:hypothetical protein n=1 Tax=Virgibacillus sp. AGTR TaxID=2812055 RepID=UPI001D165623|nr:hypothetical protein [Virgibacillus sp. AGTR]MCC2248824.1 hypothetical protein [Virgibacillus sp. AGTR]